MGWHPPYACYGRTDLDVAGTFDAEAELLLTTQPGCARIVASPLRRCRLLAERIAARRRVGLEFDARLAEMDFGDWEMVPWDAVPRAGLDAWAADFPGARPHGGESVAMLAARVGAALADHARGAGPLLLVTHMGPIRALLARRDGPPGWDAAVPFGGWVEDAMAAFWP